MNLCQSHVLVSQPLLKIQGTNLKLKNPRFITNISPGIFRAVVLLKQNSLISPTSLTQEEDPTLQEGLASVTLPTPQIGYFVQ